MRPRESEQNVPESSQPAGLGLDAVPPSGTGALWEVTAASSTMQERALCPQEVAGCDLAWWPVGAGILNVEGTGEKKMFGSSSISQALGSLQPAAMESNFKGQPDQLAKHKVYV